MIIDAALFDCNDGEYVEELSLLQSRMFDSSGVGPISRMPRDICLRNCPKEGQLRSFVLDRVDRSGGDIAGWRFREARGPNWSGLKILIIND